MARTDRNREGLFVSTTIHLTNADVVKICDTASPVAAFTSLLLTAADAGLSGPVLQAVAAAATWRLKTKNADFGHRGVRIKFKSAAPLFMMMGTDLVIIAATLRIKPPED
jgi:hypothetical protein